MRKELLERSVCNAYKMDFENIQINLKRTLECLMLYRENQRNMM